MDTCLNHEKRRGRKVECIECIEGDGTELIQNINRTLNLCINQQLTLGRHTQGLGAFVEIAAQGTDAGDLLVSGIPSQRFPDVV